MSHAAVALLWCNALTGQVSLKTESYTIMQKNTQRAGTVLVVDDDPEWRSQLCGIIGSEYPVIPACDGDEALRIAANAGVKVIILDVMMTGGKDGFQTFCALKKSPETKDIPVIMLSSVNQILGLDFSPDNMEKHLGHAPFAFLEKPASPAVLMKTIASALDGTGS